MYVKKFNIHFSGNRVNDLLVGGEVGCVYCIFVLVIIVCCTHR